MNIFNNIRTLSRLHLVYERCVLLKFRKYATQTKRNRCPNVLFQLPVRVSAIQYGSSFRCYSELSDRSNFKNETSKDEPPESSTKGQRFCKDFSLDVLVALLKQENAVDICVIKVPEQIKYAEYFIIASGLSTRHLKAMALYATKVYKYVKKAGDLHVKIEGKDAEDWMCVDFGNMVVHFMLQESREVYELEKLWTLRNYDEQLKNMPVETLPEDFIYDIEVTK